MLFAPLSPNIDDLAIVRIMTPLAF